MKNRLGLQTNTGRTHFKDGHIPLNKGTGVYFNCQWCGKECYKWRKLGVVYKFCSNRCKGLSLRGPNHPLWKGGSTSERDRFERQVEYKIWRTSVFERDNYTCQLCNQHGGQLNADHIKKWADYPKLRFNLSNGRTLCVPCHRKTPTWGNRKG